MNFRCNKCKTPIVPTVKLEFNFTITGASPDLGGISHLTVGNMSMTGKGDKPCFTCSKCGNSDLKEIQVQCNTCGDFHDVHVVSYNIYTGITCKTCGEVFDKISEGATPSGEKEVHIAEFFHMTGTPVKYKRTNLITILSKPISI